MADNVNILVGTVGQGIMRSPDGGESWQRVGVNQGMYQNPMIRALTNHPGNPKVVFAGTERGLYRSADGGLNWHMVDSALNGYAIWTLAIDPTNPQVMYAGSGTPSPVAMFRSNDGGSTWERRPMEVAEECPIGLPQMTRIAVDPTNPRSIWAGIEVDGLRHSSDVSESSVESILSGQPSLSRNLLYVSG